MDWIKDVCEIAKEAGNAIMKIYHESEGIEIIKKADNSPLTAADKASNEVICAGLQKLSVDYPIISEENKSVPYGQRKDYDRYWLIDPLDGTKEFIKRNGEFTVNIALVEGNRVIAGVVYAPVLDELYWASKGEGAFMQQGDQRQQLQATTYSLQDEGLKVVCSRSHLNDPTKAFVDALNAPELLPKGSSLKFLEVAIGRAHIYPRIAPTMEWDTAAAQIIVEEAGGKVVQYESKKPVVYNKEDLLNPFFVAYGKVQEG